MRHHRLGPSGVATPCLRQSREVGRGGFPKSIRVDQGSEVVSRGLDLWAYANGIKLDFSRPGKRTDNALGKAFTDSL